MRDAQPINDAFYRVDQGEGTEADFETIRKFVDELQNERATSTEVPNNPLEVAATRLAHSMVAFLHLTR